MASKITPKQVARGLGVSESSVKRWCDKGVIETEYTAGGHRRVALSSIMQFLSSTKYRLVHPEALGLPASSGTGRLAIDRARGQLTEALLGGDELRCRQIAIDLYLAEFSLSRMCDEVFAQAFVEIGDAWACGEAEVFEERHGCEILDRILDELLTFVPTNVEGPLAIGGTPTGDYYSLGTKMAELVLSECHWTATSLGMNLPLESLANAVKKRRPKLLWLSCSYLEDENTFLRDYRGLYEEVGASTGIVVGGRALHEELRQQMQYSAYCDNMQHLESFATTLRTAITDGNETVP